MHSFSLTLIMEYFELYYTQFANVFDVEVEIDLEFEFFLYLFNKLDMNTFTKIWLVS